MPEIGRIILRQKIAWLGSSGMSDEELYRQLLTLKNRQEEIVKELLKRGKTAEIPACIDIKS